MDIDTPAGKRDGLESGWTRVVADGGGASLVCPPTWESLPDTFGACLALAEPFTGATDEFRASVNVVISTPSLDSLDDIVAGDLAQTERVLVDLIVVDAGLLKIGETHWARLLMAYRGATHPVTLEQRTALVPDIGSVVLSATTDTGAWASKENTVHAILDSVTLVPLDHHR